jgi:Concanavalin A-like lectin/glucanases superfamily
VTYAATVLADSPAVYYRLGDAAAPAVPSPGLGVNAAAVGAPSFAQPGALGGDPDTAVSFPGSAGLDYLQTASSPGAAYNLGDGPFSIEFWYKWGGYASAQTIANSLGKGTGAYVVRLNSTGKWVIRKSGTGDCFVTTASFNDQASWHHVVITRLLAAQPHIYVDGADQAGTHTAQTFADSTTGFSVGVDAAAVTVGAWLGLIDEVALYKSALSQAQVLAHFAAGQAPLPVPPAQPGRIWLRRFHHPQLLPPAPAPVLAALAESGSAADALAVTAAVPLAESGSAADALAVTAAVPLADAGAGAEALAVGSPVALADAGTGTDTLAVTAAVPLADAGAGAEALAVAAAVPLADAGGSAETVTVSAAVPLAEGGTGDGTLAVTPSTPAALAETGSAADLLAVAVTLALAETGSAADLLAVLRPVALADAGTGTDALASSPSLPFTIGTLTAATASAGGLTATTAAPGALTAATATAAATAAYTGTYGAVYGAPGGVLTAADQRAGGPG